MLRAYYVLVATAAGAAALALEVLAARAMAPALGSGPVAWSAVLAVALGMLAAGNLLGGWLSDRRATDSLVVWSLVLGAALLVVLSRTYPHAMRWAAGCSLLAGALVAAALTQAAPMCLLGILSPVIVADTPARVSRGRWAGLVLAAGSAGGIAGALATGLWLLPALGIARTYLAVAAMLAAVALPLAAGRKRIPAAAATLVALVTVAWLLATHAPSGVVQSRYGQLEVRREAGATILLCDGMMQTAMPAALLPGDGLRHGYLLEAALMRFPPPRQAMVVGLGAGLASRLLAAHGVECRSVEVDPAVVRLAREEFGFDGPVSIGDGRTLLGNSDERFDLIFLDVCTSDRLPWHLFTVESLAIARDRLAPDGLLVVQFIGDDGPWSASLTRTADAVFGRSVTLAPRRRVGAVGPRWLLAARRGDAGLPPAEWFDGECPWEEVASTEPGALLGDGHFTAERDWARTAAAWRRLGAD